MDLFNHNEIIEMSVLPDGQEEFDKWIEQNDSVEFLLKDAVHEDIIVFASLPHLFVHGIFVPVFDIKDVNLEELIDWHVEVDSSWSIVMTGDEIFTEQPFADQHNALLKSAESIVIRREFHGVQSVGTYFELNQKLTHILDLHFLEERQAWCKLDSFGDIVEVVKITKFDLPNNQSGTVITFKRDALSEYSGLEVYSLFRMFDFTRFKSGSFIGWNHDLPPKQFGDGGTVFGRAVVMNGHASYFRGFQKIDLAIAKNDLFERHWPSQDRDNNKRYATFIAFDFKNEQVTEISCGPDSLANYFTESELPFTMTPAFFKPEVLLKYKTDRAKYKLESRSVSCRGSWHLKTFDINKAGQVHTYLGYLGNLPYEEQLHWKQYNEKPKAPISDRAIKTDFEGSWDEVYDPLESIKRKLDELNRIQSDWWSLTSDELPERVHYPVTASRDEWAEELLNLDQLLVEGLKEKWLRRKAKELKREPKDSLRALKLLEECLVGLEFEEDHAREIMSPFHEVHNFRSLMKGHSPSTESKKFEQATLKTHGSFKQHFRHLCTQVDESLMIISNAL